MMHKSEKNIFTLRGNHKWKGDTCIYCGCLRIKEKNPNATWDWTHYVNTETGEISRKIQCKTKQLSLF